MIPLSAELEELCQILELSLNQLLGVKRQAENVQKVMDYAHGKAEEPLSLETIGDVAPLMKPDMLNHLAEDVQGEDMNLGELCGLAPFLTRKTLESLVMRVDEDRMKLSELSALAPFVGTEVIEALAEKIAKKQRG